MEKVFEYRGVRNLVYAPVTIDDNETGETGGYKTGTVKRLGAVAEIGKTTSSSSEVKYYDNVAAMTVTSVGADELTITTAALPLEILADITGQTFKADLGAIVEGERTEKYFAIGYITKGTDGKERYVWRHKGSFSIPDESSQSENDGTDTTNTELTYTGISTVHKFTKNENKPAKALIVDERLDKADLSTFFNTVTTIDTLVAKTVEG